MTQTAMILSRRVLVNMIISVAVLGSRGDAAPRPRQRDDQKVQVNWELPSYQAKAVATNLGLSESSIQPAQAASGERGGPLLVVLLGAVALTSLAEALLAAYRDIRYGGLIVQEGRNGVSVRNDPRLSSKVIIIRDKKGVTVQQLGPQTSTAELAGAIVKLSEVTKTR